MNVPVLETERLRLRAHSVDDFPALKAMWSEDAVTHYIGGKPMRPDECWTRLMRYRGLWPLLGYGYWAIEETASGRYAGDVGFADFKRAVQPALDAPEIGWALMPWAHGRGLATEAVGAAVGWGDRHLGPRATACMIDPDNAASIRVAAKCGYREFARATYKGQPTILFRRDGGRPL